MLIAQSLAENIPVMSNDRALSYGETVFEWAALYGTDCSQFEMIVRPTQPRLNSVLPKPSHKSRSRKW